MQKGSAGAVEAGPRSAKVSAGAGKTTIKRRGRLRRSFSATHRKVDTVVRVPQRCAPQRTTILIRSKELRAQQEALRMTESFAQNKKLYAKQEALRTEKRL